MFATTHWSVVLAAGQAGSPQAQGALETLCRSYWYPLHVYVRRFHAERERCSQGLDPDARATACGGIQLTWLPEWGLDKLLISVVSRSPALEPTLAALTHLPFPYPTNL